jgi:hypothetical protein
VARGPGLPTSTTVKIGKADEAGMTGLLAAANSAKRDAVPVAWR